jgi:radical SAM superfamily enzyme YgiQ (UPF0313 family)
MTRLRTLLINPPARALIDEPLIMPPLGLASLAASAERAGFPVDILDAFGESLTWEAFAARLRAKPYDVIGLTGMTPVFDTVKRAVKLCRPLAGTLMLGGAHATAFRAAVFDELPELDLLCIGEGEETLVEVLTRLQETRALEGVPGVLRKTGSFFPRPLIENLDALPFPAWEKLPMAAYRYPLANGRRVMSLVTSRGCPYPCLFCDKGVFGARWRSRSATNVLAEIDELVQRFEVDSLVFYDDLFTLDQKRLTDVCEGLIRRNYRLSWKAEGRVNLVDPQVLSLMKKAGCDTIAYGVESANPASLAFLRKGTTPDMARRAFRLTRKAGIRTMGYFILGIPVETYEEAQQTIQFAADLRADYAQFSILSPMPGSELFQEAQKQRWYAEVRAHNFFDKDARRPVLLSRHWNEERLDAIIREAHRRFYFRPGYILKSIARRLRPGNIRAWLRLAMNMLTYSWWGRD